VEKDAGGKVQEGEDMRIKVNGKDTETTDGLTVGALLKEQKVEMAEYVSVQINDEILPRNEFETRVVLEGDIVEFLYYMGGGAIAGILC
jgi:sulfur carrier protein